MKVMKVNEVPEEQVTSALMPHGTVTRQMFEMPESRFVLTKIYFVEGEKQLSK